MLKVYLDDVRIPPDNSWILVACPEQVINLLTTGGVTELSLDHDLGLDCIGNGNDVVLWLENAVGKFGFYPPPIIECHSANPSARQKMEAGIKKIKELASKKDIKVPIPFSRVVRVVYPYREAVEDAHLTLEMLIQTLDGCGILQYHKPDMGKMWNPNIARCFDILPPPNAQPNEFQWCLKVAQDLENSGVNAVVAPRYPTDEEILNKTGSG